MVMRVAGDLLKFVLVRFLFFFIEFIKATGSRLVQRCRGTERPVHRWPQQ